MDSSDLEEQALIAVQEAIGTHTVAIDISLSSKDNPDWCTGSLIFAEGRPLIITCKHAVRPDIKKEDFRFLFRSEKSFQWVTKNQIKKIDIRILNKNIYKTFPKTIPVTNIIHSNDQDDLALLEVDKSWADENMHWFLKMHISKAGTPESGHLVYYMGFSRELTRKATSYGDIGVFHSLRPVPLFKRSLKGSNLLLTHITARKKVSPGSGLFEGNRRLELKLLLMLKKRRKTDRGFEHGFRCFKGMNPWPGMMGEEAG